jgi:hypothetical protein
MIFDASQLADCFAEQFFADGRLEHAPEKLIDFSEENIRQLLDFERFPPHEKCTRRSHQFACLSTMPATY